MKLTGPHGGGIYIYSNYLFFLREKNKGRDVAVWLALANEVLGDSLQFISFSSQDCGNHESRG